MLALTVKTGQALQVGDTFVRVEQHRGDAVKLVISSPDKIRVLKDGIPPATGERSAEVTLDIPPRAWGITKEVSAS